MTLTRGDDLLLVAHRDWKDTIQHDEASQENYAVTIRIESPPTNQNQASALRAGELGNGAFFGGALGELRNDYGGRFDGIYFYTNKRGNRESAKEVRLHATELEGQPFDLGMVRNGVEYERFFSADGSKWTSIGKQALIDAATQV